MMKDGPQTDVMSAEERSRLMARIRSRDTKPEIVIRKALFALGFRYRLGGRGLPGRPDLVLPRYRAAVFVHGCFWHRHGCSLFQWPKGREAFWRAKLEQNVARDRRTREQLMDRGWRVIIIWECAIRGRFRRGLEQTVLEVAHLLSGSVKSVEIGELQESGAAQAGPPRSAQPTS